MLEIHLAVILFGLAGLFGKLVSASAVWIAWGRVFFASLALGALLLARRQPLALAGGREYGWLALAGLLLAAHWTAFFHAIQVSTVAVGLLSFATFPVFIAFLEPLACRENLRAADFNAALVAFAGVAVVVPGFAPGSRILIGFGWGTLSGLLFALLVVLNRTLVRRHSSLKIAFYQDVVAFALLSPLVLPAVSAPAARDWALLAFLGVICTACAHSLFIRGMLRIKARLAGILASLEPVYGILFAALLIGERPGWRILAGGALIVGGACYAAWHQPPRVPPAEKTAVFRRP